MNSIDMPERTRSAWTIIRPILLHLLGITIFIFVMFGIDKFDTWVQYDNPNNWILAIIYILFIILGGIPILFCFFALFWLPGYYLLDKISTNFSHEENELLHPAIFFPIGIVFWYLYYKLLHNLIAFVLTFAYDRELLSHLGKNAYSQKENPIPLAIVTLFAFFMSLISYKDSWEKVPPPHKQKERKDWLKRITEVGSNIFGWIIILFNIILLISLCRYCSKEF